MESEHKVIMEKLEKIDDKVEKVFNKLFVSNDKTALVVTIKQHTNDIYEIKKKLEVNYLKKYGSIAKDVMYIAALLLFIFKYLRF